MWEKIKESIGAIAPWIAGALGGPATGAAVGALCGVLGLDPKTTKADDITKMVQTGQLSGDQLLALKKADQDFQLQMKQLEINDLETLQKLAVDDRKSARDMKVQTQSKTPDILVFVALGVWFLLNGFLMLMAWKSKIIPPELSTLIGRVLGTMDTLLGAIRKPSLSN
jgi:hypothetical protein